MNSLILWFTFRFRIAPSSFFQTNTGATEILYSIIKDWAGEVSNTTYEYCFDLLFEENFRINLEFLILFPIIYFLIR